MLCLYLNVCLTIIDTNINVHLVKHYVPILVFVKHNKWKNQHDSVRKVI